MRRKQESRKQERRKQDGVCRDSMGVATEPIRPVVLVWLLLGIVSAQLWLSPAAGQERILLTEYQYNNPKLKSITLDGGVVEEPFALPPAEWLPVGCDYDSDGDWIYWTHGSTPGTIRRAHLDGTDMQLLVSGLKIPRGLSVDPLGSKIYWAEAPPEGNALGLLRRANTNGSNPETIYAVDPYDPVLSYVGKPTVDPVNGYVYFCSQGQIRRIQSDGSGYLQTVVRGVTTTTAVALDVGSDYVYFLDANTNSDYIGRARLNDTGFQVLFDNTPGVGGTSGLFDIDIDQTGGRLYFSDELQKTLRRIDLGGGTPEVIYTSPSGLTPTALTLDERPLPPMQDCNGNGIRDLEDIGSGYSEDCNFNGIPDECEDDPCAPVEFVVDHGSDPAQTHRTLSGDPVNGFEIFQPFDVTTGTIHLTRLDLDGYTVIYEPQGFRATVFPDDGTGTFPDETQALGGVDFQYRFSTNTSAWESRPLSLSLAAGRYWVRLTAYDESYDGAACTGTSGLPSLSRKSNGVIYNSSYSIALRLRAEETAEVDAPESRFAGPAMWVMPQPARPGVGATLHFELVRPDRLALSVLDLTGRQVRRCPARLFSAGAGFWRWDGRDDRGRAVGQGLYFMRLKPAEPSAQADGGGPRHTTTPSGERIHRTDRSIRVVVMR